MRKADIIHTLAQKAVEETICRDWKHDGYVDVEHSDSFECFIDGKKYRVVLEEI